MSKITDFRKQDHEPTTKSHEQVREWGISGVPLVAVAAKLGIDEQTCRSHYYKDWLQGKYEIIAEVGSYAVNTIRDMHENIQQAEDITVIERAGMLEKFHKSCDSFLTKRGGDQWLAKQQIEQTNVNIEAPVTDYSKLSEEDKETMREIILKAKG